MNFLTDDEKLLYDSCDDFAKLYVFLKVRKHNAKQIIYCEGDKNVPELCVRCPYHTEFIDLNQ